MVKAVKDVQKMLTIYVTFTYDRLLVEAVQEGKKLRERDVYKRQVTPRYICLKF